MPGPVCYSHRTMFNGTPIIEQISDDDLRITGITLDANASMTIVFADQPAPPDGFQLPGTFQPPTIRPDVSLAALVKVNIIPDTVGPFTNLPPTIEKIEDAGKLSIKITNTKTDETTQGLEIYISILGRAARAACTQINISASPNSTVSISS